MSSAASAPDRAPEPDPDAVVAAVLACPAVAAMSGGVAGEVATYLPGRRVGGVRIASDAVTVHVVGRFGPTMAEIGDQVGRAVAPMAAGREVRVVIDDLDLDGTGDTGVAPDPPPAGRPAPIPAGPGTPPERVSPA